MNSLMDQELKRMTSRAIERFSSLDETLSTIKDEHAREMQEARDAKVAAVIESELCKKLLAEANAERDSYMRVAVKLISQFAMVEKVFSDAKALALEYAAAQPQPQPPAEYALDEPAVEPVPTPTPSDDYAERVKAFARNNAATGSEPKDGEP